MIYEEKKTPYLKRHQARPSGQHNYPFQVVIKYPNNDKLQYCGFDSMEDVKDHLKLVSVFNKRKIVYLRISKKGEIIKEWRNLNFGTSNQ